MWGLTLGADIRSLITARSAEGGRPAAGSGRPRREENGQERYGGERGNRAGRKGAARVRILPSLFFVLYGLDQWANAAWRARAGPRSAGREAVFDNLPEA